MNRSRLYLTLLLALILAGSASLLVSQKLNQGATHRLPAAMIVVAAKDLDIGAALTPEDLKMISWSGGPVPKGAFSTIAETSGRAVLYPIFENEVILNAKLAPTGSGAGLPAVIPQGMRAVSIRVDDVVAVAGFVGPGTRVDVLLTGVSRNESLTKTILENVQVLAAGQKIQPDSQGKAEKVNVVTLLCSTEDAARVTMAANDGHIQLILRNPMDTQKADSSASVARSALYGEVIAPARRVVHAPVKPVRVEPPPLPPPPPVVLAPPKQVVPATVTVVRGGTVTTVEVPEYDKGTNKQ